MTRWALEENTLVRYKTNLFGEEKREEMGTVDEFVKLFETCQERWSRFGWDLEKLLTCVRECEFD